MNKIESITLPERFNTSSKNSNNHCPLIVILEFMKRSNLILSPSQKILFFIYSDVSLNLGRNTGKYKTSREPGRIDCIHYLRMETTVTLGLCIGFCQPLFVLYDLLNYEP